MKEAEMAGDKLFKRLYIHQIFILTDLLPLVQKIPSPYWPLYMSILMKNHGKQGLNSTIQNLNKQ